MELYAKVAIWVERAVADRSLHSQGSHEGVYRNGDSWGQQGKGPAKSSTLLDQMDIYGTEQN